MQEDLTALAAVTVLFQNLNDSGADIFALLTVKCRLFDLRVDTDIATGGDIQTLNHFDFFLKGRHSKATLTKRKSLTECLHFFTILSSERFSCVQGPYLFQGEINRIIKAITTGSTGELFVYVGCTIQGNVMQDDQIIVTGHHQILFDIMRALRISHRLSLQRMLGQITAGTSVGNYDFLGVNV